MFDPSVDPPEAIDSYQANVPADLHLETEEPTELISPDSLGSERVHPTRYENVQLIGNGAYSEVYLGREIATDREVALKYVSS
jgi:serine/threonine protein kinase